MHAPEAWVGSGLTLCPSCQEQRAGRLATYLQQIVRETPGACRYAFESAPEFADWGFGCADQCSIRALVSAGGLVDALPAHVSASQLLAHLCEGMAGRVAALEQIEQSWRVALSVQYEDLDIVTRPLAVARRHLAGLQALRKHKTLLSEEQFDVLHKPWMVIKELPSTEDSVQLSVTAYAGTGNRFLPDGKSVADAFWVVVHQEHYQLVFPLSDVTLGLVDGAAIPGDDWQNDYRMLCSNVLEGQVRLRYVSDSQGCNVQVGLESRQVDMGCVQANSRADLFSAAS